MHYRPTPLNSTSHPLFAPRPYGSICPVYDDRWDLRTSALGCTYSTLTVVAMAVSVLLTLVGVIMVWLGARALKMVMAGVGGWWTELRKEGVELRFASGKASLERAWLGEAESLWWGFKHWKVGWTKFWSYCNGRKRRQTTNLLEPERFEDRVVR